MSSSADAFRLKPPRWLIVGGLLFALITGVDVVCRGGERARLSADSLQGPERPSSALRQHGVAVTSKAEALLAGEGK